MKSKVNIGELQFLEEVMIGQNFDFQPRRGLTLINNIRGYLKKIG